MADVLTIMERLEQSNKLMEKQLQAQAEELAKKQNAKPLPPPPNVIVEELPRLNLEQLKIKLADEVIEAWVKISFKGELSRQLNVFNKLNTMACQELLKEILVRKEK